MIRIEAIWLAVEPMGMRPGMETALAPVVKVFGAARPHHAFKFAAQSEAFHVGQKSLLEETIDTDLEALEHRWQPAA